MKLKSFLVSLTILSFLTSCQNFDTVMDKFLNKLNPSEKHVELQKLEIDIQKKILEGDKNGAFDLLKNLVHPSELLYTSGYTYDEWWREKREELKKQIMAMGTTSTATTLDTGSLSTDSVSTITEDTTQLEEIAVSEPVQLPENYLGLYVMQFANGSTKFYKFFNDANGIPGVVYQDNVSGNVRVENYVLRSFNEITKEVELESKKNSGSFLNVRFVADQESQNGFKLFDSGGSSYSLVGK